MWVSKKVLKRYTQGQCAVFAHALWLANERKGGIWVIYGYRFAHFYYKRQNGHLVDVFGTTTMKHAKEKFPYKIKGWFDVEPVPTFRGRNKKYGHNGGHVSAALRHIKSLPLLYRIGIYA